MSTALIHTAQSCIMVLALSTFPLNAQPVANSLLPQVDERVELLGIVYGLATPGEVNQERNPSYAKAVSHHFLPYRGHPLVQYIHSIADSLSRKGDPFDYWDLMALSVHLGHPPMFEPLVALRSTSDDAWDSRTLLTPKMIRLIQEFYRDARCAEFLQSQRSYFESVDKAYTMTGAKLNRSWFAQFFGLTPTEKYYAVLGLTWGNGEYLRVNYQNNHRDTYTIFATRSFDHDGIPNNFHEPIFSWLILHEYVHAFVNQLVDKHVDELRPSAEIIIANPRVYALMKDTFYGNWQYLLYESFVRACHLQYLKTNDEHKSRWETELANQEKAGFFWMRGLVNQLGEYESNRKNFKNLDSYMPQLIEYFREVAKKMKK